MARLTHVAPDANICQRKHRHLLRILGLNERDQTGRQPQPHFVRVEVVGSTTLQDSVGILRVLN